MEGYFFKLKFGKTTTAYIKNKNGLFNNNGLFHILEFIRGSWVFSDEW